MSAPEFVVTNVGLAAASIATPVGPFVHIQGFRVGSGYGYTPLPTDTNLNGTLLFQGVPSTYQYIGDNTINVVCKIPADAGPFDFGEVALDLTPGTMFAKAVFDTPQTKYSSLGTNVLSTYTFNCLLKLEQSVAIFKIDTLTGTPPSIWEVDFWSDVYPPALMANPLIPAILVRELDANGNSTLIHQAADDHWTVGSNYKFTARPLVAGGTVNDVTVAAAALNSAIISSTPRNYVIEFADGYLRSCSSVSFDGSFYHFHTIDPFPTPPVTGSFLSIFTNSPIPPPTQLTLTGDVQGTALLNGGNVSLSCTVDQQSISGRSQVFDTAGTFPFTVPPNVFTLFADGCAGGAGGGGAGGGYSVDHNPGEDYRAGGGGGGGGAGESVAGHEIPVTPGQIVMVTVGAKGIGGLGGVAPGNTGGNGTSGGNSSIDAFTLTGGTPGIAGTGNGLPSGGSGSGGPPGDPGGSWGTDGGFGGAGGPGGTSPFGSGGSGGRAATIGGPPPNHHGIPGNPGTGNGSGGGGGGAIYVETSSTDGGAGGDGTDGIWRITW